MKLLQATLIADDLVRQLKPYCHQIEIAGSIRRKNLEVKDIEIVLTRKNGLLYEFKTVMDKWRAYKGEAIGRYTQREIKCEPYDTNLTTLKHVACDFFMPLPDDYYRQLAIRTGPKDFSHKVIATGWNRKGWVGTDQGLRRENECVKKAEKWVCMEKDATIPPVWQSEEEFFKWIGVKYVAPEERGLVAV